MYDAKTKARNSDPETSHQAALDFAPYANQQGLECLEIFYQSSDRTIGELARIKALELVSAVGSKLAIKLHANIGLCFTELEELATDGQAALYEEKMSRRANELVKAGLLEVTGKRKCAINDYTRNTYTVTKQGVLTLGHKFKDSCWRPYQKDCGKCPACGGFND